MLAATTATRVAVLSKIGMSSFLCVSLISGCGSSGGRPASACVSGKVTCEGKPVTEGVVNFVSTKLGTAGSGALNALGEYEITEGIPPGNYQVYVSPPRMTKPPMPGEPPPETKEYASIPEKVRNEASSELIAEVKPGANNGLDFKLD